SIVYAVVIPSFLLTVISFISDISKECEKIAGKRFAGDQKISELAKENADIRLRFHKEANKGICEVETKVPEDVLAAIATSEKWRNSAVEHASTQSFFLKCIIVCNVLVVVGYVLLFLSLFFSPIIFKWISVINLNCITLWSLTVLYLTIQLKREICNRVFSLLHKINKHRLNVEELLSDDACEE
ncbi:MAG: hypothetical protein IJO09_01820, partial [Oscillospiraceae bacterium]|nr:hypothetical protein [Oscillospiraceae bacterium]